jgi:zinc D-Ala-D-Ala carboxypeptidase
MARMLSTNFTLDEFIFSQTAARLGIDNTPPAEVLANLKRLAQALEQVRSALGGAPILISSGYRSPALNRAVKGARNSAHVLGLAVDFTAPRFGTVLQTAKAAAASGVAFDQIIHEFGRWVHLAIPALDQSARAETLTIQVAGVYTPGLRSRSRQVA